MNKVILCGNLVRDNKIHYTQGGMAFLNNCVAVKERTKSANGEWSEKFTFIEVAFFGRTAENVNQYLQKGSKILIEGKIDISQYQTQNGENRKSFKVICENMEMLGGAKSANNGAQNNQNENFNGYSEKYEAPKNNGAIPF